MNLDKNNLLQSGKYRIIRVLGQGGFGITYLAEHTILDKLVAIKEFFPKDYCMRDESGCNVKSSTNNDELINTLKRRFIKEAKNIAKLDHSGIIKIHDVFEENDTAYYVMDYIEGENLSQIVKQNGPLSEEKAIDYIIKVGEALEYMHSKKMTHFDVKPANIIIRKDNDAPVLIDFGLSKQYSSSKEETSTLLQAVSNGFSPIELYTRECINEFSPQTDVYSLGATLYYLLSGTIPPNAISLISNNFSNSSISIDVFNIIRTAMAIDLSKRYNIIANFIKALIKYNINISSKNINIPFIISNNGDIKIEYKNKIVKAYVNFAELIDFSSEKCLICLILFLTILIPNFFHCIDFMSELSYETQRLKNSLSPSITVHTMGDKILHPIINFILMLSSTLGLYGMYLSATLKIKGLNLLKIGLYGTLCGFICRCIVGIYEYKVREYIDMLISMWQQKTFDSVMGLISIGIFTPLALLLILYPIVSFIIKLRNPLKYKKYFIIDSNIKNLFWIILIIFLPILFGIIQYFWELLQYSSTL